MVLASTLKTLEPVSFEKNARERRSDVLGSSFSLAKCFFLAEYRGEISTLAWWSFPLGFLDLWRLLLCFPRLSITAPDRDTVGKHLVSCCG